MARKPRTRKSVAEATPVVSTNERKSVSTKPRKEKAEPAARPTTRASGKAQAELTHPLQRVSETTPQDPPVYHGKLRPKSRPQSISSEVPRRYNLRKGRQTVSSVQAPTASTRHPKKGAKLAQALTVVPETQSILSPRQSLRIQTWVNEIGKEGVPQALEVREPEPEPEPEPERTRSDDTGNLLNWYRSYGYQPPEPSSMASTIAADAAQQAKAQLMKSQRTPSGAASLPQFYAGLRDRNVDFSISEDDARQMIKDMLSVPARFEVSDEEEANWKLDLLKCEREQEAVFQRTIMMDAISRHKLGDLLDYTCESPWTCDPMPRRNSGEPYKMALPKPDLAIAFKSRAIISPFAWPNLTPFMKYICPEAYKEGKADRVFHFFSLEVKGANFNPGDFIGVRQNFNTASQALHNMWTFMKIANQESTFFKDVRFFSATATSAGFQFRVHRAVMVGEDERIENDYPLGFHFDEIFRTDANYKRSDVSVVVQNILFEYGVKTLLPILKSAVTAVLKKVRKNAELQSALGKRPAEETIDSFNTQRQAIGAFQLDNSQDSVLGQTIAA